MPVSKKADFETLQTIKWCPGCGNHSVLATVQKFLATQKISRENTVFVSGIGCSSRFPYYVNTYGFHSIHGRAPAIATGVKLANPDLSVWLVTGDGDALSIGGNHLIHLLRRNLDMVVLLLNNRIYGLTKGQYSPTSSSGMKTKSSPYGSPDKDLRPISLALGTEGTFVARTLDVDTKMFTNILQQAVEHKGTAFIEVFQSCAVFNEHAFDYVRDRSVRTEAQLPVEHGKPLVFGKNKDKGLVLNSHGAKIVHFDSNDTKGAISAGVTVFDETNVNHGLILTKLPKPPLFPTPVGVFYKTQRPTFEDTVFAQQSAIANSKFVPPNVNDQLQQLFHSGTTWEID